MFLITKKGNEAKFYSRSHDAVVRIYDQAGNVIETHDHVGESFSISKAQ
jgi:hypothetical protein